MNAKDCRKTLKKMTLDQLRVEHEQTYEKYCHAVGINNQCSLHMRLGFIEDLIEKAEEKQQIAELKK